MEAFMKLNWRTTDFSLLTSDEFIPESSIADTYVFKGLSNVDDIKIEQKYVPGKKFFRPVVRGSILNVHQHQECLHALLVLSDMKEKRNAYDNSTLELYNRLRQSISNENLKFSTFAKEAWNRFNHEYSIDKNLKRHAKAAWKSSLDDIKYYPQRYRLFEALSIAQNPSDYQAELIHKQKIFDLGAVGKYIAPIFEDACFLHDVAIPSSVENNLHFKLRVSEDRNIDQIVDKTAVHIVISSGSLVKLMEADEFSNWDLPIVIKPHNGRNVVFIDKPMHSPKPDMNNINTKAYKNSVKLKFCGYKGFSYDANGYTIKENKMQDSKSIEDKAENKIHENTSYTIWSMKPICEKNELLKSQFGYKELNILVRSKIDACELLGDGKLQPISIVPKLEHQLEFGGNIPTKSELIRQWCYLQFRPQSILYRVRIHPESSEVIMIDKCNIQRINHEAQSLHNFIPHNGLQVLYRLFIKLATLQCGNYLLHHTIADGAFVSLLEKTKTASGNVYNLHDEYNVEKFFVELPKQRVWTPIDCSLVLPVHKALNIMPGMFRTKGGWTHKISKANNATDGKKNPNGKQGRPTGVKKKKAKKKKGRKVKPAG